MNFKEITIEECQQICDLKEMNIVLSNGEVVGFEKSIKNGDDHSGLFKFVYYHKSKPKCFGCWT